MGEITIPNRSRRTFPGTTLAGATGLAVAGSEAADKPNEGPIRTLAGHPHERVRAIQDGRVSVEGRTVQFQESKSGKQNVHVFNGPGTRDASEVGLIPYLLAFCNDDFRADRLLPIFVLKIFRHKSIFIHADRSIREPADLRGRRAVADHPQAETQKRAHLSGVCTPGDRMSSLRDLETSRVTDPGQLLPAVRGFQRLLPHPRVAAGSC